ncbi:MAG: hypothetical protein A2504_03400 [Bdellovibrionales bacterium RIFOXYD12_FULL_39_22]|nr:MAG: hypothetical protein A2385_15810 [Bdellovibrionales bacterium RIFOXYB1_FULL_39_21]OFZ41570.1 MAG: hypothetical protein A2485_02500 [Bdellovibrionales bacterium RIFOXYC12_FULL_39_17]OFZ45883.1 MAG: hypothetical protein A2404_12865 [Bdellovibrionales bacterium RIFOXYC1_FULL_39_130]OFZ74815.1 MAG: hypothetical protein A2560_10295 [Bdellovibrionales bacterium RIFOXYD1_FULL_39_84]OFZ92675.1 MAG: hypothetical protein A2504_03400 [Bdellovibrionales bacterium RIFOXYD12_FULL_39_22]HLE11276.1 HE
MKLGHLFVTLLLLSMSMDSYGSIDSKKNKSQLERASAEKTLLRLYENNNPSKTQLLEIKKQSLELGGKAVPVLIEVMKSGKFADKNRWIATFLLGKIMGEKSAPFIAKFTEHPSWIMRMASLKTLLALNQEKYGDRYAALLKDNSFIVRLQALENIRHLNLANYSANVWAMLYDKKNYYASKDSKTSKRTNLIKEAIKVVGDLKFTKAQEALLKMSANKKYSDIFQEIDYSLEKITGKKSPAGNVEAKRIFWKNFGISNTVI